MPSDAFCSPFLPVCLLSLIRVFHGSYAFTFFVSPLPELQYALPFKPPRPLVNPTKPGHSWDYQRHEDLLPKLRQELLDFYAAYTTHTRGKTSVPLLLVLSGPGLGKSRTLQELPHSFVDAVSQANTTNNNNTDANTCVHLHTMLKNAISFNISSQTTVPRHILQAKAQMSCLP